MENNTTHSDRGPILSSATFMALVLILHGLAHFRLPAWLWGANTLYALAGVSATAALVITALFLIPSVSGLAMRPLGLAGGNRVVSLFGDKIVATVLAGSLSLAVFWRMGVSDPVANGWLFHSPYASSQGGSGDAARSLPVPFELLMGWLSGIFNAPEASIARGLSVAFGVALVCLVVLIPLRSRGKGRGAAAGMLLAVSGAMLVFLIPRADLAFEVAATGAFLILGAAAADGRRSAIPAGLAAWCAALVHPIGLALLPAWAFLIWRREEGAKAGKFLIALSISVGAVVLALALLGLTGRPALAAFLSDIRALWLTGSGTRAGWVVGSTGEGGALDSMLEAAGWLSERIWGAFNGIMLAAPAGLALAAAAVLAKGWRNAGPTGTFMGFAALSTAVFASMAAPYSGAPRSWGIFAPAGICATVFGAWWLMERVVGSRRYRAAALGAVVLSLMHFLPALYVFTDPGVGVETLVVNASSSTPWDVRGRADTLERLSAFHLAKGDTVSAAVRLAEAWDARPNPLYLGVAGTYYASANRYTRAEREFARLVAIRPVDIEANLSLGILHAVRRDMEGAKRYLLVAYGDTTLSLPEAEMDGREAWENMPKGPEREEIILSRARRRHRASQVFIEGDEAARQGLLNAAMRQYEQALAIYPRWGKMQFEARTHIGTIHAMQGRFKEAAYELLVGINSFRNYPVCYYIVNGVGYGPVRPAASIPHAPLSVE